MADVAAPEPGPRVPAIRVIAADPAATWPLRHAVLRPHQAEDELRLAPGAAHLAAADEAGAIIGVGSVSPEPHPRDPRPGDWRLQSMATSAAARGTGAGGLVLTALLAHARAAGGARVWCNARMAARGFYERYDFVTEGEPFLLPEIGAHILMTVALR